MEVKIENVELVLPKKVPKHGKVSGIKAERDFVRVIVPKENTKLTLSISEPSEVLFRNVTPNGKILGLTKFIGKRIYVIDQEDESFEKETGLVTIDIEVRDEDKSHWKKIFEYCEKNNIDFNEYIRKKALSGSEHE